MTSHLSPRESIAALEGPLEPARQAHLDACARCRQEVADLGATLAAVRGAGEVDEPSPIFWDQWSARVREAAQADGRATSWPWRRFWQPLAALAAAAVLAVWVLGRAPADVATDVESTEVAADTSAPVPDDLAGADDPWETVVEMAADLSVDDVHRAVPSRLDTVVLFDELSDEERAALGDLLASELSQQKGLE